MFKGNLFVKVFIFVIALTFAANANAEIKNIILLISDGWGQCQLDATAYWNGERAVYETDDTWVTLGMSNYMYHEGGESAPYGGDGFVGLWGYDPAEAWSNWEYMMNYATDSAAAGTAMSTATKTYKGSIGMGVGDGENREELYHVSQLADELGLAYGVVSSVQLSHATPASFIAHNVIRGNYAEIALEMTESNAKVIMGAGHPNYDGDGLSDPGDPSNAGDWKYVGGYDNWMALEAGTAGGDNPWTLVEDKSEFEAIASGSNVPERLFGVAQVSHTLQYNRTGMPPYNDPEAPYTVDYTATIPSLETMTMAALKVLEQDEDGFFLMVEGGAIDWAGHGRTLGRLIEEQDDFNNSVDAAIDWVETNSNWEESLIIVTGDHETGYLWGAGVDASDETTWFTDIQDNGADTMPGFYFYSEPDGAESSAGHTNQIIPFYAKGYGTDILVGYADETDTEVGDYLDNTEVGQTMFDLLNELSVDENTTQLPSEFNVEAAYPNPFNPTVNVNFSIPANGSVKVALYDITGREVIASEMVYGMGSHTTTLDASNNASGVYFLQVGFEGSVQTQKVMLVK